LLHYYYYYYYYYYYQRPNHVNGGATTPFVRLTKSVTQYDLSVPEKAGMSDRDKTLAIIAKYRAAEEEEEEREMEASAP